MLVTRYNIKDLPHGLRICVAQDMALWERMLTALVPGIMLGVVSSNFLKIPWCIGISFVLSVSVFFYRKAKAAELSVSHFEFVSKGDLGRRVQSPRVVMAAQIRGLEFQENSLSGKSGLYVWTGNSWKILLPFLDWQQTNEIIDVIKKKLPGLAENWR